jgi:hypothetical protein
VRDIRHGLDGVWLTDTYSQRMRATIEKLRIKNEENDERDEKITHTMPLNSKPIRLARFVSRSTPRIQHATSSHQHPTPCIHERPHPPHPNPTCFLHRQLQLLSLRLPPPTPARSDDLSPPVFPRCWCWCSCVVVPVMELRKLSGHETSGGEGAEASMGW